MEKFLIIFGLLCLVSIIIMLLNNVPKQHIIDDEKCDLVDTLDSSIDKELDKPNMDSLDLRISEQISIDYVNGKTIKIIDIKSKDLIFDAITKKQSLDKLIEYCIFKINNNLITNLLSTNEKNNILYGFHINTLVNEYIVDFDSKINDSEESKYNPNYISIFFDSTMFCITQVNEYRKIVCNGIYEHYTNNGYLVDMKIVNDTSMFDFDYYITISLNNKNNENENTKLL